VIAGAVGVGLAEVACDDRSVDGRDDLGQGDLFGVAGQYVATPDSPFGSDETGAFEGQQDLFEVGLWQRSAIGNVAHRSRRL